MASCVNICLSVEDLTSKSPTYCDVCLKSFKNSPACKVHMVKFHKIIATSSDESILRKIPRKSRNGEKLLRYFCPIDRCKYECKKNSGDLHFFPDRRSLKQHYDKVHTEKRFLCSFCSVCKFSLERDLRYHEKICGSSLSNKGHPPKISKKSARKETPTTIIVYQPVILMHSETAAQPMVVEPAPERLLLPKPNSSWCCFVSKVDAGVQVGGHKEAVSRRRQMSAAMNIKPKDISTQCDESLSDHVQLFNEAFHPRPPSSCSLHLYDEIACQTSSVQTFVAAVQSVVPQSDIFCQTNVPSMTDASVMADIGATSANFEQVTSSFIDNFDESSAWSNIETQTDVNNWDVDFDDIWRHMQTQTTTDEALFVNYQQNIETQTSLIDFLDSAFQSAGTQT